MFGYAYDASGNLAWRTNRNLKLRFQSNGLNQLTNVSRTGTLTVAGTLAAPSGIAVVTVSGTGLANHQADLYTDGAWASTNSATLADGMNSFTATVTDGGQTSQQSISAFLPASLNFQYDGNGNLTNDGVRSFEYDLENQLIVVSVPAAWRSEFQYDGLGRRRARKEYSWTSTAWNKTNEVRYIYDGRLAIQERDANNTPQVTYTRGLDLSGTFQGAGGIGGLLARSDHSTLAPQLTNAFYHCDGNGNVTCMVNGTGQVVARYRYDPYGNLLAMTGPLAAANLYRFSSKEYHPNSGLIYYLYRYYGPNQQRWINRDPLEEAAELNLYGYCLQDPISKVDPCGLAATDFGLCVAACYLGFKSVGELTDLYWAWKDPSQLPRHVRRRFELAARESLTGSRQKPTEETVQKASKELARKRLRVEVTKRAGKKAAKILAPNLIPSLGQIVSAALLAADIGKLGWCSYQCSSGQFPSR